MVGRDSDSAARRRAEPAAPPNAGNINSKEAFPWPLALRVRDGHLEAGDPGEDAASVFVDSEVASFSNG